MVFPVFFWVLDWGQMTGRLHIIFLGSKKNGRAEVASAGGFLLFLIIIIVVCLI